MSSNSIKVRGMFWNARILWAAIATVALAAPTASCKKQRRSDSLPAASDWSGGEAAPNAPGALSQGSDPHAGMNMGANTSDPNDPHAGMNMSGDDPHAGMNMAGGDPNDPMNTMQPPNPNRAIDDSKFLKGTIVATEKTASLIKSGAIIFIAVRPIEPVTGEIIGGPIAVDRIDVGTLPQTFHLSERQAMSAGTRFAGDVQISARVDADGEARSRSPGDVEGTVRAKIPADKLTLKLDTVLR